MNWITITEAIVATLIGAFLIYVVTRIVKDKASFSLFFKRIFFRIFPVNFNVAFSIEFKDGLNSGNYFEQIKKNFNKSIIDAKLENQIRIKDCSNLKKFETKDQAEKFRNEKNNIDLIIWGDFTNDNLKVKGEVMNKLNLSFTFGYPGQQGDKLGKLLQLDVKSKFAKKNYWQVFENNSYEDLEIISGNIFNISSYILAVTLKLYGRIKKSLNLFEHLYFNLLEKDDELRTKLIPHLINCYEIIALEKAFNGKDYDSSIDYCNRILKIRPNSFFAISNLAVFHYKAENFTESNKYVETLKKLHPKNTITIVDLAFIKILEKDYIGAYSQYSRLLKCKKVHFNAPEVVDFLYYEYEKSKEPAFLFGSGIINYYFGDRTVGKKDLEFFIKKAKSSDYNIMTSRAHKLL